MLPEGLRVVKGDWFRGSGIRELFVSGSVEEIESNAFDYCQSLTKVTFAEGSRLKTIGQEAFAYTPISEFEVPQQLANIGAGAFAGTSLKKFVTSKQIKTIGSGAFRDCKDLKKFSLNSDIQIPDDVFQNS